MSRTSSPGGNVATRASLAIGARVRVLREAHDLTQDEVAKRGGITRVDVSRVESGHNQATSHKMVIGLAMGFGVDAPTMKSYLDGRVELAELLSGTTEPARPASEPEGSGVGGYIRRLYRSRGFNRNSFAKTIGASYNTILAWERNGRKPGTEKVGDIHRLLHLTADESGELTAMMVAQQDDASSGGEPNDSENAGMLTREPRGGVAAQTIANAAGVDPSWLAMGTCDDAAPAALPAPRAMSADRASIVKFIRGAAVFSANRDELLALAKCIADREDLGDA